MSEVSPGGKRAWAKADLCFNFIGYLLLALALLYFLENLFEVYVLTAMAGPQMVGYVLSHASGTVAQLWLWSMLAYSGFALFSLIATIRFVHRPAASKHVRFFSWCFLVISAHGMVTGSYGYWSQLFDRAR